MKLSSCSSGVDVWVQGLHVLSSLGNWTERLYREFAGFPAEVRTTVRVYRSNELIAVALVISRI